MLTEVELKNIFKDNLLIEGSFRAETGPDIVIDNLESFVEFVETNGIKTVFYNYSYYDFEDSIMDIGPDHPVLSDEEINSLENLKGLDYEKPYLLEIFVVHQGAKIAHGLIDSWLSEHIDLDDFHNLMSLIELYDEDDFLEFDEDGFLEFDEDDLFEEFKAKLLEFLEDEPDFKKCNTVRKREDYLMELLNYVDFFDYEDLFEIDFYYDAAVDFLNQQWNKLSKK